MQHDWIKSTLGHGDLMCRRCFVTSLEAAAIGMTECEPPPPKAANQNAPERQWTRDEIDEDMGLPFICPVTSQPCMTEQDEFCEDYGCARLAGIDVDRDII